MYLDSKGNVIPTLQNANIVQASEAMRVGPIPMPRFGPGQLDEVQMSAIAHYVMYLQHPDQRGAYLCAGQRHGHNFRVWAADRRDPPRQRRALHLDALLRGVSGPLGFR